MTTMQLLRFASLSEIFQCAIAMVGLVMSQREVWRQIISLVDLTDTPLGDLRRLVALKNVSVEMILTAAQGVLFTTGAISLFIPPPDAVTQVAASTQSVIVHLGMVAVTVLLTFAVYVKVWLDSRFLKLLPHDRFIQSGGSPIDNAGEDKGGVE